MFTFIKTVVPYLFSTNAIIRKKADEFKSLREERYVQFDRSIASTGGDDDKTTYENDTKSPFSNFTQELGLATLDDINEIKDMIEALSRKIEAINKR